MVLREDEKVEQGGIVEKQQRINKDWLVLSPNCVTTNDEINFYILFRTELNEFILYTTGLDKANFTINQIDFWLNENKINVNIINQYKEVATALEMYLYNPFAEKMPMGIMYEKGVAIIRSLTAISKVKTET